MMASKNLIQFATEKGLYEPAKDGKFNFSKAYTRDDERDRTYNDPRVWTIQKEFQSFRKSGYGQRARIPGFHDAREEDDAG